jgi:hypothetical protein
MIPHYDELVQKLEGFKHISWKKNKETDDHKFTFSIVELSGQSLCLEGAVLTQLSKKPLEVNEPSSAKKRSACADVISKVCNKENQVAAMRVMPSASCQHGQYKSSKDHIFRVPEVPQLWTSKPSMHRLTAISKYYKHPLTKAELGKNSIYEAKESAE